MVENNEEQHNSTEQHPEEKKLRGGIPLPINRKKPDIPLEIQLLVRSILALLLFILGFNFSRSAFFAEYPLFGVSYLAEIIISTFAAFIGFFYVPKLLFLGKNALENLMIITVAEIVNHFWDLQSKRIQEQRRIKQLKKAEEEKHKQFEEYKGALLIDTSALIDGRIVELVKLHFIESNLIIPQFVIDELHTLSDSKDDLKRKKGRRGLDIIRDLKKKTKVLIPELKNTGEGVDKLLIKYAKENKTRLMTMDFNLNKVASVSGIKILNINELANSIKTVILPGEEMLVKIIHEGKEKEQGVGYLQDGTMIIVDKAKDKVSQEIGVKVNKIIQSPAGKIIFASVTSKNVSEPIPVSSSDESSDVSIEVPQKDTSRAN
jgi:uncharacterized protein YacL